MEVPIFFMGDGYFGASGFSPEKMVGEPQFVVDDLLEIPNDDASMADGFFGAVANSGDSCSVTPAGSCNSSVSGVATHFDSDLCVSYEDMAELEWLSNFVEDSFSAGEDLRSLHVATGVKAPTSDLEEVVNDKLGLADHLLQRETVDAEVPTSHEKSGNLH